MLKAVKDTFNQKKLVWAEETAGRIEEYAARKKQQTLHKMKKEEELNHLLHQEMDKYLYAIHPSFLLHPDAARTLHNRLLARSEGRLSFSLHITSEIRLALDFYHSDLVVFIRLLEKKGVRIEGNEERFINALSNKLSENNYRIYMERFGDFADHASTLEEAVCRYLEIAGDTNKHESGRIDFLIKYLINKQLLVSDMDHRKMKRLLKTLERKYAEDYQVTRLERRMGEIG
ncbi:hypothetical protein [Salibacterium sp. K-3]